jgi:hypothetical protein
MLERFALDHGHDVGGDYVRLVECCSAHLRSPVSATSPRAKICGHDNSLICSVGRTRICLLVWESDDDDVEDNIDELGVCPVQGIYQQPEHNGFPFNSQ